MEYYKNWVRRNKDYVHSLESLANGLTWLLPERFSDSEIGPEAVSAFVGILTAINDHIIETTPTQPQRELVKPSSFSWPLSISALKELETLVEVAAQHFYGEDKKWNLIAIMEGAKVLLRFALFRDSGYKMLFHGGETPNVEESRDGLISQQGPTPAVHHGPGSIYGHNMQNTEGRALSSLHRFGKNAKMVSDPSWATRFQHRPSDIFNSPSSTVKRPTLSTILTEGGLFGGLFLMAEVLHITRPLIYVLFIRKYGVQSWIPWLLSLGVDLSGISLLYLSKLSSHSRQNEHSLFSALEKNEIRRRKLLWAFYLMRDPFFSKYTRQKFEKTQQILEPVPVIGFLTAKIIELVIGAQTRYTYMSGS